MAGPAGSWAFNEGSGLTVLNGAAANYPGTLSGATPPAWGSSPYGRALTFNGSTSYIAAAGSVADFGFLVNPAMFTIAARIRISNPSADAGQAIIGGSISSSVRDCAFWYENRSVVSSPKALRLFVGSGTVPNPIFNTQSLPNAITDSNWHHVVGIGKGNTAEFYIDGAAFGNVSSVSASGPVSGLANPLVLGATAAASGFFFSGDIEHVQIFPWAFSAVEVLNLYLNPYRYFAPPPGVWQFGPPSTTTYFLWPGYAEECLDVLTY